MILTCKEYMKQPFFESKSSQQITVNDGIQRSRAHFKVRFMSNFVFHHYSLDEKVGFSAIFSLIVFDQKIEHRLILTKMLCARPSSAARAPIFHFCFFQLIPLKKASKTVKFKKANFKEKRICV